MLQQDLLQRLKTAHNDTLKLMMALVAFNKGTCELICAIENNDEFQAGVATHDFCVSVNEMAGTITTFCDSIAKLNGGN